MKFKELINKSFPNSAVSKYVSSHKHPILESCAMIAVLIFVVAGISILNGSGQYSHPFQKHHLIRSARTTTSKSQQKSLQTYASQEDAMLKPNYYKMNYSPESNTMTMNLGSKAYHDIQEAQNGKQSYQEEITDVLFGQIAQSKQMTQSAHDKKLGFIMMAPNGTMLSFVQNGHVHYSVLPVLSTVK